MRSRTPRDFSGVCSQCFLKNASCICTELPRVESKIEILIIRHTTEDFLTSNTGRLAALMLPNARIIKYGGGEPFDDSCICRDGTWLLYPGKPREHGAPDPKRIIVLDATFRQARRMYKRITALRSMPELSFDAPAALPHRLRHPPRADGLSTIEAIATALSRFESPTLAEPLLAAYAEFVRRADATRGRQRG
jgi:DTW domain-containing protein YfiP